jgi:hypothetical protein
MELTGKIIAVLPAQSGVSARTGNSWMTQQYVLEASGKYPKKCVFSVFGEDRIRQFNIEPNEEVTVHFDVDAREYNGKWYNELKAYNVLRATAPKATSIHVDQTPETQQELFSEQESQAPVQQPSGDPNDDLPF